MVSTILKKWYGDFSAEELKKYVLLGLTFALIIGVYWTLRPLKDSLFAAMVVGYGKDVAGMGKEMFLAWAKVFSLVMLIPFIIGYSKLVDKFHKHHLLYILGAIYLLSMFGWALLFLHPTLGLANTVASPWRIAGWFWYVFVESFGSLFIALFWAFTVDISDQQSAKRGFALIVMIGQVGGILLPNFLTKLPRFLGTTSWPVVAICGLLVGCIMLMVRYFVAITPKEYLEGYKTEKSSKEKHEEPGFFEGLKLLVSHKYLLGIFAVVSIFEVIVTIIDYNFKILAFVNFSTEAQASEFLGSYASSVNTVAFLCLLLGINNVQRWLGIRTALALVPLIVGGAVLIFFTYPQIEVLFYLMVGAKAINYALNGPSLKQLYIPTTEDVKYKTQAWIEAFGSRGAKASASFINISKSIIGTNPYMLMVASLSLGLAGLWFFVAIYLANNYNRAIKDGAVVC